MTASGDAEFWAVFRQLCAFWMLKHPGIRLGQAILFTNKWSGPPGQHAWMFTGYNRGRTTQHIHSPVFESSKRPSAALLVVWSQRLPPLDTLAPPGLDFCWSGVQASKGCFLGRPLFLLPENINIIFTMGQ